MKISIINNRTVLLFVMTLLAALTRLIPHPINFAPLAAMALFGGAYFSRRTTAVIVPLTALWISDLVINFSIYGRIVWIYEGFYWVYGSFILIAGLGYLTLKKVKISRLIFASISASALFFVVSNFGVWYSFGNPNFPSTVEGLLKCYIAGLPYFWNTLAGDLFYTTILFGSFEWAQLRFSKLKFSSAD